jgi:hypothetical protein
MFVREGEFSLMDKNDAVYSRVLVQHLFMWLILASPVETETSPAGEHPIRDRQVTDRNAPIRWVAQLRPIGVSGGPHAFKNSSMNLILRCNHSPWCFASVRAIAAGKSPTDYTPTPRSVPTAAQCEHCGSWLI